MMDASSGWNGHDPTLSAGHHDDFLNFDLAINNMTDSMNFDFQDFANQNSGQIMHQGGGDPMDTEMNGDMAMLHGKDALIAEQMPTMTSAPDMSVMASAPMDFGASSGGVIEDLDQRIQLLQQQRQYQQQKQLEQAAVQRQQQFYGQNRMVPPTPNSTEMHSTNNQFYAQTDASQQAYMERYQLRLKEQELAFTPLVSPAVTPLESHFNLDHYTVPGAYFSPLSSPALHAQNEHRSAYEKRLNGASSTTSPIDMGHMDLNAIPTSAASSSKKVSKNVSAKSKSRSVRQSPIVKPQRRKAPGSTTISPQALADIMEPALSSHAHLRTQTSRSGASGNSTTEGSENDSVSPEQLSDMAPPPLPRSTKGSPFSASQNAQSRFQQSNSSMSPATPASLMRIAKGSAQASPSLDTPKANTHEDQIMDGFCLPEPANPPRPSLARLDTQGSGQTTPTLDSTRAAGYAPLPSPLFAKPHSARSSPQILAQSDNSSFQPTSATSTPNIRKTPQLAVRGSISASSSSAASGGSKKRASMSSSSVLVSPALRPRISPSIKPLIRGPNGAIQPSSQHISDDTASLLLASKSNYQNILEGTHLPGVNYPTELSTNLTSKRTSHKIAEQGRRNRINSALAEIATLLPKREKDSGGSGKEGTPKEGSGGDEEKGDGSKDGKDGKDGKGGQSANSKASTVECAIDYIKQLKLDLETANRRAEEAERRLRDAGGGEAQVLL